MLLRYLISIQVLISFTAINSFAQKASYFGLDFSKTITYNSIPNARGVIIEPVYLYQNDSSLIRFKLPIGFSHTKRDEIYVNSNLKTTGFYIKPGIGFSASQRITPFVNLLIGSYTNKNRYVLEGSYYGDYVGEYTHKNLFAVGIEQNVDIQFKLNSTFSLILSPRFTYIFYNSERKEFPVYYVPGGGITNNSKITGGVNVYIVW